MATEKPFIEKITKDQSDTNPPPTTNPSPDTSSPTQDAGSHTDDSPLPEHIDEFIETRGSIQLKILDTAHDTKEFYDHVMQSSNGFSSDAQLYTKNICTVTNKTLDIATAYNLSNRLKVASNLADFSQHLLTVGKRVVVATGQGLFRGASRTSDHCRHLLDELSDDPVEYFKKTSLSLCKATSYLCIATLKSILHPREFCATTERLLSIAKHKLESSSYEDIIEGSAAFVTELILTGGASGAAVSELVSACKIIDNFAKYSLREFKLQNAIHLTQKTIPTKILPKSQMKSSITCYVHKNHLKTCYKAVICNWNILTTNPKKINFDQTKVRSKFK